MTSSKNIFLLSRHVNIKGIFYISMQTMVASRVWSLIILTITKIWQITRMPLSNLLGKRNRRYFVRIIFPLIGYLRQKKINVSSQNEYDQCYNMFFENNILSTHRSLFLRWKRYDKQAFHSILEITFMDFEGEWNICDRQKMEQVSILIMHTCHHL